MLLLLLISTSPPASDCSPAAAQLLMSTLNLRGVKCRNDLHLPATISQLQTNLIRHQMLRLKLTDHDLLIKR